MKIKCGDYDILHSGTVNSVGVTPIELEVDPSIILSFNVQKDGKIDKAQIEPVLSGAQLRFTIINPHKLMNIGLSEPMHVGFLNERKLYLVFRVNVFVRQGLASSDPDYTSFSLDYTLYSGKPQ